VHERGIGRPATGRVQNSRMKKMQHGRQNGKTEWCRGGSIERGMKWMINDDSEGEECERENDGGEMGWGIKS
jgi:hypothetical protein